MRYDQPALQDALAARLMLGGMHPRVRRRLAHLAATRPALRQQIEAWQRRALTLAASVPPQEASPGLWKAIDRRTGGATPPPVRQFGVRLAAWLGARWLALGGSALGGLVLGGLAMLILVQQAPQRFTDVETLGQAQQALPQSYIGILSGADGRQVAWVSSTRQGRRLFVKLANAVPLAAGESLQLRALALGQPPQVLGALAPAKGLSELPLPVAAEQLFKPVDRLQIVAVTAGGVLREVASGPCAKIW